MLIKKLYQEIETDFPLKTAAKWDYSGFQCGFKHNEVTQIFVSLDLTTEVIDEAIMQKANVIITHHPFCFGKKKTLSQTKYKQEILKRLKEHQISVYAVHTNYDGLMNELILQELNVEKIIAFAKDPFTKIGYVTTTADEIITKLKTIFNITMVQHNLVNYQQPVATIALAAGAGGDVIAKLNAEVDLFITGEVKWNEWVLAHEKHLSVVCFNHYMEDFFSTAFAGYLKRKFLSLPVTVYHIKNIINYR